MEADFQVEPLEEMPLEVLGALAELHCEMLQNSVPALLGRSYAARFYAAVAKSAAEDAVVVSDRDGVIAGAGLVTTKPDDLGQRMLKKTFLAFLTGAALTMVRGPVPKRRALVDALISPPLPLGSKANVLVYLFVRPSYQNKGIGGVVVDALDRLAARKENRVLRVLTEDDSNNTAVEFYARLGFARQQRVRRRGNDFVVLERQNQASVAARFSPNAYGK